MLTPSNALYHSLFKLLLVLTNCNCKKSDGKVPGFDLFTDRYENIFNIEIGNPCFDVNI